jgi:hypothetical protein
MLIFQGLPIITIGAGLSTFDKASVRIFHFITSLFKYEG